jgi:hypothetical protein
VRSIILEDLSSALVNEFAGIRSKRQQCEFQSGMDEEAMAAIERARRDPRKRSGAEWVEKESRGGLSWHELHKVQTCLISVT